MELVTVLLYFEIKRGKGHGLKGVRSLFPYSCYLFRTFTFPAANLQMNICHAC